MTRPLALVTGASGGIGAALAREFAAGGHDVVLAARSDEKLRALADELSGEAAQAHVLPCDLADRDGPRRLCLELDARGLAVDALVNNAGYGLMGGVVELDLDDQLAMIDLNVRALVELTARLTPAMVERGRGGVLNVASAAAFMPGPGMAVYYATKAFVLSFSEALWQELSGSGVRATALCPGPVRTGFQERANMESSGLAKAAPMMSAQETARAGYRAFARGRRVIVPAVGNKVMVALSRITPRRALLSGLHRFQKR